MKSRLYPLLALIVLIALVATAVFKGEKRADIKKELVPSTLVPGEPTSLSSASTPVARVADTPKEAQSVVTVQPTREIKGPTARPVVIPEWYSSKLIDVQRETLDEGIDPRIGARTRLLKKEESGVSLRIRFRNLGRCMLGDLDLIEMGLRKDKGASLLLTVEPLKEAGPASSVSTRLTLEQIGNEGNAVLTLPLRDEPSVYGVYICTDSQKSDSCKAKRVVSLDTEEDRKEIPQDRLYYFNPVVLEGGKITLFKQPSENDVYYPPLSEYISKRLASQERAASLVKQIESLNTAIRSGSMQLEGTDAVIDLPKADPTRCEEVFGSKLHHSP